MKQDIEKLLELYYEGETTLAQEKQLRRFFQQESVPPHLESHMAQFRYFAEVRDEHASLTFNNRLDEKLRATEPGLWHRLSGWGLRIAAGLALLILGFIGGTTYPRWGTDQTNPQITGSLEDKAPELAIKKVLAFEQTSQTSASQRIQAVNQSYELVQADEDITQLLINTLNFDENVNVRLSACRALLRFEDEPRVREALIQSLLVQTDPNLQIALIEALVAIQEKRAVESMQRLVKNQEVLDIVRLKAEEGLNRLQAENSST